MPRNVGVCVSKAEHSEIHGFVGWTISETSLEQPAKLFSFRVVRLAETIPQKHFAIVALSTIPDPGIPAARTFLRDCGVSFSIACSLQQPGANVTVGRASGQRCGPTRGTSLFTIASRPGPVESELQLVVVLFVREIHMHRILQGCGSWVASSCRISTVEVI